MISLAVQLGINLYLGGYTMQERTGVFTMIALWFLVGLAVGLGVYTAAYITGFVYPELGKKMREQWVRFRAPSAVKVELRKLKAELDEGLELIK